MALEDLFKVVKDRSKADTKPKADTKVKKPGMGVEIPRGLLFKCPRCGTVMTKYRQSRQFDILELRVPESCFN